jgi:hypothetical protein
VAVLDSVFRTENGGISCDCPKYTSVSDTLLQEVGRKFGMRVKTVLTLHRQKDKSPTAERCGNKEKRFKILVSNNKKEKNYEKFQEHRSTAASEHRLNHHLHIMSR